MLTGNQTEGCTQIWMSVAHNPYGEMRQLVDI